MNLEYLRTFFTTVQANSISKAAKQLHISQPGVSIQIQALEKELGFELLIRSNKGVELTDAGKIVFDYAVSLLSIQGNIERELDGLKSQVQELVVSSCTTVGSYSLPCSLYLFKEKFPSVKILLDISNSQAVINNIINNNAKLGIVQCHPQHPGIEAHRVTSSKMLLVCSPRRFRKTNISINDFIKLPLIEREEGSGTRKCIETNLARLGLSLEDTNTFLELTSTEAIKSALFAEKGFAILPEICIKQELALGTLQCVEINEISFDTEFYLAYQKEKTLKGPEKDFYDFIKSSRRGFC